MAGRGGFTDLGRPQLRYVGVIPPDGAVSLRLGGRSDSEDFSYIVYEGQDLDP